MTKKTIKYLDPAIKRKSNLAKKNLHMFNGIPLPAEIEISSLVLVIVSALSVREVPWI